MIRPFTCLAFLLACGSGLYLYQSKHRVQLLDRQIAQTIRATEASREQTRMLHAEWTLLNDPERLRQLSDQFLTLRTVAPGQFTSMADLDGRLPAPVAPPTPGVEPPPQVVAAASDAAPSARQEADAEPMPIPPIEPPAPAPARIASAAPLDPARVERKPLPPRPAVAQPARPRVAAATEPHPIEARASAPRPMVATAAPHLPPAPAPAFSGSLLGMARGAPGVPAPQPLPRPIPVNATQSVYSPGG